MFKTFFFSELKYVLKQPMVYIFMVVMGLMVFAAVVSDNVQIGGSMGSVYENSPHAITMYVTIMSLFGLLIATAFFNNAALREHSNNFNEILFSTPVSKAGYFFGRFFGALLLATIPMLGVFLGVLVGSAMGPAFGWIGPERVGPFFLETFVNNYFLFILPNMFFAGALIYAMAHKWKSTIVSFVGALVIMVGYSISGTLLSDIDNETMGALADTFGIRTYSTHARYFTPIEKNTLSPPFSGLLLANRAIWIGLGAVILLVSYFSFSFKEKTKKIKTPKRERFASKVKLQVPQLSALNMATNERASFISFFKMNFLNIAKSMVFKIIVLFTAIILIVNLFFGFQSFGLKVYPLTYQMIELINGASGLFVMIILVFFSGELIWRDRDNNIHEVVDSTPHTSFTSLAAKTLSLVLLIVILHFSMVLVGVLYQLLMGYTRIEPDVYLIEFFIGSLPSYLVMSGIMIFIQVLMNNKYLAYFVSILFIFSWGLMLQGLDIDSNMIRIGGRPSIEYSDMNGFGPGLYAAQWFNVYWLLFSVLCVLAAGVLWNRGILSSLKSRIKNAKKQLPEHYALGVVLVGVVWLAVSGFVYYNTQVLNPYITPDVQEARQVEYEKLYKQYETRTLPKITDVKYHIDIFPEERDVFVRGEFVYTNESNHPIDSIFYSYDTDWHPEINIPSGKLLVKDSVHNFMIIGLSKALMPGASMNVEISTKYLTKGFENELGTTEIVRNGTFLNSFTIMPSLGYQEAAEISDKNLRRKYELPAKQRMPELAAVCGHACNANYLSRGTSDYINFECFISTSGDQRAIAPGSMISEWQESGRNHFHYKVDHPSQHFFSFISANYEVAKRKWKGIDLEVYYDKHHSVNVEMMLDAIERSLEYYTTNFGPYYHKQCRIIEFPRYASFAQAFPGTMPYSEAIGFVTDLRDDEANNIVDAVIAHEMAHQWWAHQVVGAQMQGGTMMSESFAEYSSLMTMKSIAKTPMKMREFLKYDHQRYLRGRSRETDKELPLYKVENQQHIHYGKGSVILYALQDHIGEDKVNTAMRTFLEEYRYQPPPYPTSLDFMRHLEPQVPDSMKYLINDWFKEITLYDNRMKEATFTVLPSGKFKVDVLVSVAKMYADTLGNETTQPLNEWIDIGAFADSDEEDLIFEKRVKIDQPEMSFTFELDTIPAKMAIDPRRLLVDRVYEDNVKSAVKK